MQTAMASNGNGQDHGIELFVNEIELGLVRHVAKQVPLKQGLLQGSKSLHCFVSAGNQIRVHWTLSRWARVSCMIKHAGCFFAPLPRGVLQTFANYQNKKAHTDTQTQTHTRLSINKCSVSSGKSKIPDIEGHRQHGQRMIC